MLSIFSLMMVCMCIFVFASCHSRPFTMKKSIFYGRCLISWSDESKKPCPKKDSDNHSDRVHCPHRDEYERETLRFFFIDKLEDEYGYCPISFTFSEELFIKDEAEKQSTARLESILDTLP